MPRRYLLDTSALVAHWQREPGWTQVQKLFDEADTEILAASVTLTELLIRRLPGFTGENCKSGFWESQF